ncbi:MAG: helix-turn-helix domain-containing protein [Dehalococcoidia bacterium]|jgi:excisionase family DNA binding protein
MALKDKYITVTEAAEIAGVTRQTISRWIAEGHLIAEKVGRQVFIKKEDFGDYLKKQDAYRMAAQIISGLAGRIYHEYNYTEEDKINFLKLDSEKDIFHFSVVRKDGTHEEVSISVSKPKTLEGVQSKETKKEFLLIGYMIPIKKMERRQSNK